MSLENFFTSTEKKDGLTAAARVKELINVLQKDKHNTVNNIGDSTRQWSAVASTLASTENKDCLALFIQLNGHCYLDTWLKHGQKCFQETGDSFIEETIVVLLGAIEKLHREEQKSVTSGIMRTVKDLLSNNSSRVQDRARALLDSWKQNKSNVVQKDGDDDGAVCDDLVDVNGDPVSKHEQPECSSEDVSTSRGINNEEKKIESAVEEITPAQCPETMQTEVVADKIIGPSDKTVDCASIHDASPDPVNSCMLKPLSENSSVLGNPREHQLEATTGIKTSGSAVPELRTLERKLDAANSDEHDEAKQMLQIRSCDNLGSTGTFCADSTNSVKSTVGADNEKDVDIGKGDPCSKNISSGDVRDEVSGEMADIDDNISPNPFSKRSASDSTTPDDVLHGSSLNGPDMGKNEGVTSNLLSKDHTEAIEESIGKNVDNEVAFQGNVDLTANLSRKVETEAIEVMKLSNGRNVSDKDDVKWGNAELSATVLRKEDSKAIAEPNSQYVSDKDEVVKGNDSELSMSGASSKDSVEKNSGFHLDCDMFDPLEVARQVAIEVEREVDCREPSYSSPGRTSGGGIRLPESPDSIKGENSSEIHHRSKDVSPGPNLSAVVEDKVFVKAENLPSDGKNGIVDTEPTGTGEVTQEIEPGEDKHVCGFDLNKDVLSDNADSQTNPVTAPLSPVSASRAAAISGLPLSPLHFDGTRGSKGSAETSAFPLAPTSKVSEGENSIFASGSSSRLFQQQEYLDFDLNVAASEDYKISDLPPSKKTPDSSVWTSGESSLKPGPKRSDLLQLDLNCAIDGGDAPLSYFRKEGRVLPYFNGQFSLSASSSSSLMPPSLKTIDLNDQRVPFTEFLHPALTAKSSPNFYTSSSGGLTTNKSVISLMGAKVEVSQKDNVPETIPFINCMDAGPALDASMKRNDSLLGLASSSLYAHPYMYGYNGSPSGPTVPYYGLGGQIPYMVDSRGIPVVPQVLAPGPILPPSAQQPSFFGSLAAAPADPNGLAPPKLVPQVLAPGPVLPPSAQQPSFFGSLAAAPADPNGLAPPRHGLDLNLGSMFDGRSRDAVNTRQLFNSGQGISMDEQMRANLQSTSSSGVGGKRKEPDGGWDPYQLNYKHNQWK